MGFLFGPGMVFADDAFPFVKSILPLCVIFTWTERYRGLSPKNIVALTAHGGCRKNSWTDSDLYQVAKSGAKRDKYAF